MESLSLCSKLLDCDFVTEMILNRLILQKNIPFLEDSAAWRVIGQPKSLGITAARLSRSCTSVRTDLQQFHPCRAGRRSAMLST